MPKLNNNRTFDINYKKIILENIISILENDIPLENINDYCDNLVGLRYDLFNRFSSQTWDDTCPKKEGYQYNHCWATLDQLDSWELELTNKFFEEMKDAYSNTKLEQILAILKNEEYNPTDSYWNRVDEIKEDYFWDIFAPPIRDLLPAAIFAKLAGNKSSRGALSGLSNCYLSGQRAFDHYLKKNS